MQLARHALSNDVDGTSHRIGGDGNAAGHRFEQHQTKRVGAARNDKHIRCGYMRREFFAEFEADEFCVWIFRFQLGAGGAVADDDLGAGQIDLQKRFDVLLDRNSSTYIAMGRGKSRKLLSRGLNKETSTPRVQRTMFLNPRDSSRRCMAGVATIVRAAAGMEATQMRVAHSERNRHACANVFRELRVIRRREWKAVS